MSSGLRLMLLVWIVACAEPLRVVPDADWRTVPPTQRETLDKQHQADLAAARAELATASASLAAFLRAPPPPRAASSLKADPNDASAREHERARTDARARIDAATTEVQRTGLAWGRLRVDAANAQIEVVISRREVARAQAIDHNLPGNDHYDIAPLRGQFSHIQQRWYAISNQANAARETFDRASAALASAKEAYAQVMRGGPAPRSDTAASEDRVAHFELSGWTVTPRDLHHRGLRHLLDEASTTTLKLRKVAFQLSPALHRPPPAPSPPAPPGTHDARGDVPAQPGRPADRAGNRSLPTTAANTKPAAPPRGPAPTGSAAPAAIDHPADRAGDASAALSSNVRRPPEAPRPAPASPPAMSASGKPAERPSSPAAAAPSAPLAGKPPAARP